MQHLQVCARYTVATLTHQLRHWTREIWIAFLAAVIYEQIHTLIESGTAEHVTTITEKISHGG